MFCSKCGQENPDEAGYCQKCGHQIAKNINNDIKSVNITKINSNLIIIAIIAIVGIAGIVFLVGGLGNDQEIVEVIVEVFVEVIVVTVVHNRGNSSGCSISTCRSRSWSISQ